MWKHAAGPRCFVYCLVPALEPSWLGANCCLNAEWWSVQCKSANVAMQVSEGEAKRSCFRRASRTSASSVSAALDTLSTVVLKLLRQVYVYRYLLLFITMSATGLASNFLSSLTTLKIACLSSPKYTDAGVNFEWPQSQLSLRSDKHPYNACHKPCQNAYSIVMKQSCECWALT